MMDNGFYTEIDNLLTTRTDLFRVVQVKAAAFYANNINIFYLNKLLGPTYCDDLDKAFIKWTTREIDHALELTNHKINRVIRNIGISEVLQIISPQNN